MKLLLTLLILSTFSFGCAKAPEVKCQVYFELDENGHRINAFWDIDRGYKVDVSTCTNIYAADEQVK